MLPDLVDPAVGASTLVPLMGFFLVIVGGGVALRGHKLRRRLEPFAEAELEAIGTANAGRVEISGTAMPADAGSTVEAPFSGREALLADVAIRTPDEDSGPLSLDKYETLHREVRSVPFLVNDDTGEVLVDAPEDGVYHLEETYLDFAPGQEVSGQIRAYVEGEVAAEMDPVSPYPVNDHRRYVERRIESGDEVTIVGDLVRNEGRGPWYAVGREGPFAITNEPVEAIDRRYSRRGLGHYALAAVAVVVGLVLAVVPL